MKRLQEILDELEAKRQEAEGKNEKGEDVSALMDEIRGLKGQYENAKELMEIEKLNIPLNVNEGKNKVMNSDVKEMLKSNEYVNSFIYAIKNGITPANGMGNEKVKILYDAQTLTEKGGSTPGEDGGFLVPEDMQTAINEQRRANSALSSIFNKETTRYARGRRIYDTAPTKGFTKLSGEITEIPNDDKPQFSMIDYSMDTYGLFLPVSNELLSDNAANLMQYLGKWFGKKLILTENALLLDLLKAITPAKKVVLNGDMIGDIKKALNVDLDPAIAQTATILTNQSGFDYLDSQKDGQGRYLMQVDPTSGTPKFMASHNVVVVSNGTLPNVKAESKDVAPFFVGDFKEFGTLFQRTGLEMLSTNIGGNAFRTYSTEVRGIVRMCALETDKATVSYRQLALN